MTIQKQKQKLKIKFETTNEFITLTKEELGELYDYMAYLSSK